MWMMFTRAVSWAEPLRDLGDINHAGPCYTNSSGYRLGFRLCG